ncbi:hypothetical protein N7539_002077 [Penicillium diatomitis]|uniref:Uncharacterized protein n=1 Tax=Penicillium diatomitis TaxID=2819901 RepID=A0A9X0C0I2_9EURO|nr:uncharacterized protein N7539_002077 [Penicillium diatomitis]KAJ5493331.1 hypothetical protein N7539_002077 [Penicillium diatomitis]
MALFSRLVGYFTGHVTTPKGPFALFTPISIGLNCIGLLFLLFASITFNFPSTSPVTESIMNYTSAAVGIIGLISIIAWFTTGPRNFAGPRDSELFDGTEQHDAGCSCCTGR